MTSIVKIRKTILRLLNDDAISRLIVAVYLFGSYVREDFRDSSDIDLAFLLDESHYKEDPLKAITPAHIIAAKAGLELNREVDVLVLNSASLEMACEIVTHGQCVFEPDPERRLQYELKIKGMYLDFRPFIEELRAKRLKILPGLRSPV